MLPPNNHFSHLVHKNYFSHQAFLGLAVGIISLREANARKKEGGIVQEKREECIKKEIAGRHKRELEEGGTKGKMQGCQHCYIAQFFPETKLT